MDTYIYRNNKLIIVMSILIITVALIIGIFVFPNTNKNHTLTYIIQVTPHVNSPYLLCFPFPIDSHGSPVFNTSDMVKLIGNVHNISLEETEHGIALSVNATGNIIIIFNKNISKETWGKKQLFWLIHVGRI